MPFDGGFAGDKRFHLRQGFFEKETLPGCFQAVGLSFPAAEACISMKSGCFFAAEFLRFLFFIV